MPDPKDITDRYVAMWNEPDAGKRRAAVEALWTPDGACLSRTKRAVGWDELERRAGDAHEKWVRDEGFVFRPLGEAQEHSGVVAFRWAMVPRAGGDAESTGFDFFILADDGRVRVAYQFVDA